MGALRGTGGRGARYTLEVETLRPDFAQALVTGEAIEAMLVTETKEWSIQGRDVLTVLRDQPGDGGPYVIDRACCRLTVSERVGSELLLFGPECVFPAPGQRGSWPPVDRAQDDPLTTSRLGWFPRRR
ncbi:hypothetical protein EDD92_8072 [Streptomyces sp. TLI_185]|nr:hypothetical protein EDD92_8072 [Streptomyces sp. TLI_185]